jgi:6-phosphogluconolactonase
MNDRQSILNLRSKIRFYSSVEVLAETLANELATHIRKAVSDRGVCHMVFPGGRSPYRILEALREKDIPWNMLHLYPSDERCVPVGDTERNDRMIDELLFTHVPLPQENLHRIPAELGPDEGALLFSQTLINTPIFDIVWVGVGTDGHIASLFPNHPAMSDDRNAVPVTKAPKPPPFRVSIGLKRLLSGYYRHALCVGEEKQRLFEDIEMLKSAPVTKLNATIWHVGGNKLFTGDHIICF